jgi:hypothetical protein
METEGMIFVSRTKWRSMQDLLMRVASLDNSVSRGEKGGAQLLHITVNLAGKKARSVGEQVKMSRPLCMRQWLLQIQEMEKTLVQELK